MVRAEGGGASLVGAPGDASCAAIKPCARAAESSSRISPTCEGEGMAAVAMSIFWDRADRARRARRRGRARSQPGSSSVPRGRDAGGWRGTLIGNRGCALSAAWRGLVWRRGGVVGCGRLLLHFGGEVMLQILELLRESLPYLEQSRSAQRVGGQRGRMGLVRGLGWRAMTVRPSIAPTFSSTRDTWCETDCSPPDLA